MGTFQQTTCRELEGDEERRNYHDYQLGLIGPHCGRSVVEIGAGTGAVAAKLDVDRLVVSDADDEALAHLARRFADRSDVEVRPLDLAAGDVLPTPVDTAIAINVLEHFDDDVATVRRIAASVRPGGTVVLWVPGYDWLYGDFDRRVGHVRRYTPARLRTTLAAAGLSTSVCRPVNLPGALAWWAAVRKGGTRRPRPRVVATYDRLVVPVARLLDRLGTPPFGQSILAVAQVPVAGAP